MSAPAVRTPPTVAQWLYNHNPFYAISAVLVLYSVQRAHADVAIGEINVAWLTGVLVGYTLVLAVLGVLIVRFGQVWEDARSIFVLLLLLFLAVSVGADELFVTDVTARGGALTLLAGYLFAAVVSEAVLRLTRIRLPAAYRAPYHLLLALFFIAPWWISPPLHPRSLVDLQWTIALFPVVAAVLLLLLLPAVRRGPAAVADNGTPWRWPWFPWTLFGVLAIAAAFRSAVLSLAFGPRGPMWIELKSGGRAIAFDTQWGLYFLAPLAFAVLLLVFEAALTTRNRALAMRCLKCAPGLLLLTQPWGNGRVFLGFVQQVTDAIGAPLWIAVWLLITFYGLATLRRVPRAELGLAGSLLALAFIGPETSSIAGLQSPQAWPPALVGAAAVFVGVRQRSSAVTLAGVGLNVLALWLLLPATPFSAYRFTLCYHVAAAAVVIVGFAMHDRWTEAVRIVGAVQFPLATIAALAAPAPATVSFGGRVLYAVTLLGIAWGIARATRQKWYRHAVTGQLFALAYAGAAWGLRGAVLVVGRPALTAFLWSLAALGIGGLISAHKARWLGPDRKPAHARPAPPGAVEAAPAE